MCPGGARGCRDVGGRPRRHQRHEPIFARRVSTPTRASSSASTPERDYPGRPARAASTSSGTGRSPPLWSAAAPTLRRGRRWATSSRAGPLPSLGDRGAVLQAGRDAVRTSRCCLPDYAIAAIREALPPLGREIKGYSLADAVMTGVETRTSSPIRIRREDHYQSIGLTGSIRPAKAQAMPAASSRRRRRYPRRRGGGVGRCRTPQRKVIPFHERENGRA